MGTWERLAGMGYHYLSQEQKDVSRFCRGCLDPFVGYQVKPFSMECECLLYSQDSGGIKPETTQTH